MPAILRRRKLISIKPERKNAVTYRKEEVQAEVMTPPPAADQQKIPGSTVVCPACKREVNKAEVEKNKYVCYECGSYFRVRTKNRIRMVADAGTFEPWFEYLESENPLDFPEYTQKVEAAREKTGLHEAVTIGRCKIYGEETVLGICDARFLMSSMGHVVGEKIALGVERATDLKLPVILFCCSGGARMQEGIISLMQMAKTSAALKRHSDAGLLYVPVLTDPTTGGVTASFAMLGDIILAEPGALIGFAGPRVIEQTIGQKLPEGFQRAEFQLEHGFVDKIVPREEMKEVLGQILRVHGVGKTADEIVDNSDKIQDVGGESQSDVQNCAGVSAHTAAQQKTVSGVKTAWDHVLLSRKADRPTALDYITRLFPDFMELHGDRYYGDDGAVIGGIATFHGMPVTVIGQQKGKTTKENLKYNFGMPSPEGYRKALRLMKQAEAFGRPVICFVDTPGAFCGIEAEERGQGEAIARNLFEMADLKVPVLSIVIGEGGSGGALAVAVANQVWMMENAVYSVLSPEGFASILWKDSKKAAQAAEVMKMTAKDLLELHIVDQVIPEPVPACAEEMGRIAAVLDQKIGGFLSEMSVLTGEELTEQRYERFRAF